MQAERMRIDGGRRKRESIGIRAPLLAAVEHASLAVILNTQTLTFATDPAAQANLVAGSVASLSWRRGNSPARSARPSTARPGRPRANQALPMREGN